MVLVMKRAIGYLRVSTDKQEDGNGYATQCAVIQGWCERNGYELWFVVRESVSGASDMEGRHVFVDLVSTMVDSLESSVLVVKGRDRLARDFLVAGMLEKYAAKKGVAIATADGLGIIDASTPEGMLIKGMLDLLAQWDKMNVVMRLQNGIHNAAKYRGKHMTIAPYGYAVSDEAGVRIICEPEAEAVRRVFYFHDKHYWSPYKITEWLNAQNYVTREGNPWEVRLVNRIIKQRKFYQGLTLPGKAYKLAPGVVPRHPAIISPTQNGYDPHITLESMGLRSKEEAA